VTLSEFTSTAFTLCNTLRVLAYVPQIAKAVTDQNGAQAISLSTWGLFLFSNVSAVAYALVNQQDHVMAAMFVGNSACCAIIIFIGTWKRSQQRNRMTEHTI